jgi:hypothetical protein
MKTTNLVVSILYAVFLAAFLLVSTLQNNPYQVVGTLFFAGPVVLNCMSFLAWNNAASAVKIANLVIGILYTLLLTIMIFTAAVEVGLGLFIFFVPVVLNWLSYFCWPTESAVAAKETLDSVYSTGRKSNDRPGI